MASRLSKRSRGRPKSSERTAVTRDTVLQAAARLFLRRGYAPIPFRDRLMKLAKARMSHLQLEIEALLQEASSALTEEQRDAVRQSERLIYAALAEGFRRCQADGLIGSRAHPDLLAYAFSSLLLTGHREDQLQDALHAGPALPEQVVDLFWTGISPRMAAAQSGAAAPSSAPSAAPSTAQPANT